MKKFVLPKEKSELFRITDKIESAEDFVRHRLDGFQDEIIVHLPIASISSEQQIRTTFNQESIDQLAHSIKKEGLLYPILVMEHPEKTKHYIILVGESRFRAFKSLGRDTIPARVKPYIQNNGDRKLVQLTENIQRKDLNPIDLADSFMAIKSDLNITLAQLADRISRSISYVNDLSRIHNLSDEEKVLFKNYGFRELRGYINSEKQKSTPGVLLEKSDQLPLFKETKTGLKMSAINLNFKKESKETLENKITECESFLKEARKRLKTI